MVDKLKLDITLEEREALRALTRLTKKTKSFSSSASRSFTKLNIAFGTFVGSIASRAVISGIAKLNQAIVSTTRNAAEFTQNLGEINSLLPKNAKLTKLSTQAFIEFSNQFGTDTTEQTRAFYQIVSAGIKGTNNQFQALKFASKSAVAGISDVASAADLLTSSFNVFGKEGETFETLSNQIFETVRLGKTTFSELANTLGRASPIFQAAGLSFGDLTGAIAFLTKGGIQTDLAVTGLRQVIASLIKPTTEATAAAEKLGIEFSTKGIRAAGGFAQFLKVVIDKTKGSETALAALFGNIRALTPILRIAKGDFQDFADTIADVKDASGALNAAFAEIEKTFGFQLRQLGKQFKNLGLTIATVFLPGVTAAIIDLNKILLSLNFAPIIKGMATFGTAVNFLVIIPIEFAIRSLRTFLAFQNIVGKALGALFARVGKDTEAAKKAFGESLTPLVERLKEQLTFPTSISIQGFLDDLDAKGDILQARIQKTRDKIKAGFDIIGGGEAGDGGSLITAEDVFSTAEITKLFEGLSKIEAVIVSQFANIKIRTIEELNEFKVSIQKFTKSIRQNLMQGIGNGAANAFAAFGRALVTGENALDAFVKSFLGSIGQMAIQQGAMFILQGIGYQFVPGLQATGVALISAGAALATFGGVLSALTAGSGGGVANAGGAGGGGPFEVEQAVPDLGEAEIEAAAVTELHITIEGNVLDGDDFKLKVAEAVRSGIDEDNLIILT